MFRRIKQTHFLLAAIALFTSLFGAFATRVDEIAAAPSAQAEAAAGAWVNTYALNVRSGPGVGYQVVDIVTCGEELTVTHRTESSNWVRVTAPEDVVGWVNAYYLASNLKPFTFLPVWQSAPVPAEWTAGASVNTYALNVRSGPGVGYQVVDVVTRGEELTVIHRTESSNWVRVITPEGRVGWVNSFYLASNLRLDASSSLAQSETIVLYWLERTELRAVPYTLSETGNPAEAALEALLAGPPAGYETAIPTADEVATYPGRQSDWGERVRLLSLTVADGVAIANFSGEMQAYGGGSARVQAIREQITQTLLQFPSINEVRIAVEGEVETALQP